MITCYPPTANWYSCYCSAISSLGYYVYASRNAIVVLRLSDLQYVKNFTAANDKIQTIDVHEQLCFVAGEDPKIRVWNILDGSLLTSIPGHKSTVNVLKCIREGTLIISGDKSGTVIIQQPFGQRKSETCKVNAEVTAIAMLNRAGKDYFAVGYGNGMIVIEALEDDLSTKTVYQMIHSQDGIRALAWQNIQDPPMWEEDQWPLLASSARKTKSVIIWDVPNESKYAEPRFPFPPPNLTEQQKNTFWLELSWSPTFENILYVSGVLGMIYPFNIEGRKLISYAGAMKWTDRHKRNVFGITWADKGQTAITYSLDKQIIKWDVKSRDFRIRLVSHASFPYCIDIPSWNPGMAIIGLGESNIKLWRFGSIDTAMSDGNFYDSEALWRELQGQIGYVKSHPSQEGLLFYSTEYGRVGLWNLHASKNQRFKTYHNVKGKETPSISYVADMSQALEDPDAQNMVITCGLDGAVYLHRMSHPTRHAVNLLKLIMQANPSWELTKAAKPQTSYCAAAVDGNSRYLALGSTDGSIEIYRLDTLKIVYASYEGRSRITYLAWGNAQCPSQDLLAAGVETGDVFIHNIANINIDSVPEIPLPEPPARTMRMDDKEITSLAWSHHSDKAYLAVAAKNGFIAIWDVDIYAPVSLFGEHMATPLTVCWCRHDQDMLISGGEDRFLYMWKYTDFPYPGEIPAKSRRVLEKEKIAAVDEAATNSKVGTKRTETTPASAPPPKKKRKTNAKLTLLSRPSKSGKETKHAANVKSCLLLAAYLYEGNVQETINYVRSRIPPSIDPSEYEKYANNTSETPDESITNVIFGDTNALRRMLGIEAQDAQQSSIATGEELDLSLAIDIMRRHFETFGNRIASSSLGIDSWITLALSPMAGKDTWLKLMEEQARKLESTEEHVLAATCYLACSRAYDAVSVYRKAKHYKEAVAIAKLWLPSQDTLINTLFAEWADVLQAAEQDGLAAMCFLQSKLVGSTTNAINMLSRRKSEQDLFWAACLAHIVKDSRFEEYLSRYLTALDERVAAKNVAQNQDQN